jgi:hypothetical protein
MNIYIKKAPWSGALEEVILQISIQYHIQRHFPVFLIGLVNPAD